MMNTKVAIIIPALNEADSIGEVVRSAVEFGDVIVVNDGSTDRTKDVAEKAGAFVITHVYAKGYDDALGSGYSHAQQLDYAIMITIDADGQLPTGKIPDFLSQISKGKDLVIGYRASFPRYTEFLFAFVCRPFLRIQDPFCGMKAYRLSACSSFDQFDRYKSIGTDLMLRIALAGGCIGNEAIVVQPRDGSPRFGNRFGSELKLLRAVFIGFIRILKGKILNRTRGTRMAGEEEI
jgi:glycosyltransferase involved in cell wall biosynthesis